VIRLQLVLDFDGQFVLIDEQGAPGGSEREVRAEDGNVGDISLTPEVQQPGDSRKNREHVDASASIIRVCGFPLDVVLEKNATNILHLVLD